MAERYAAVGEFIAQHSDETHPVTRNIILCGTELRPQMPSAPSTGSTELKRVGQDDDAALMMR